MPTIFIFKKIAARTVYIGVKYTANIMNLLVKGFEGTSGARIHKKSGDFTRSKSKQTFNLTETELFDKNLTIGNDFLCGKFHSITNYFSKIKRNFSMHLNESLK